MADEQQSTTGEAVEAQPESNGTTEPASISDVQPESTDEQPTIYEKDIRALQSKLDKQVALREREIKGLRAELDEMKLQTVPEEERELTKLRLENERLRQENDAAQKFHVLNEISTQYGVPISALEGAENTIHAQAMALAWYSSQQGNTGSAGSSPQPTVTSAGHQPFIAPEQPAKSSKRDYLKEMDEALAAKDVRTYNALRREMEATGQ